MNGTFQKPGESFALLRRFQQGRVMPDSAIAMAVNPVLEAELRRRKLEVTAATIEKPEAHLRPVFTDFSIVPLDRLGCRSVARQFENGCHGKV